MGVTSYNIVYTGVGVTCYHMVYIVCVYVYSASPERRFGDPGLLPVVVGKWKSSLDKTD